YQSAPHNANHLKKQGQNLSDIESLLKVDCPLYFPHSTHDAKSRPYTLQFLLIVRCKVLLPYLLTLSFSDFQKYLPQSSLMNVVVDRKSTRLNSSHVSLSY